MEKLEKVEIVKVSFNEKNSLLEIRNLIKPYALKGLMLLPSIDQLTAIARKEDLFIAKCDGAVIATASIAFEYPDGSLEFGGWAVEENSQNMSIGKEILKAVVDDNIGRRIFALGNDHSGAIFHKLGYSELLEEQMHPDVFAPCKSCNCDKSQLDDKKCVDKIYKIT